MAKDDYDVIVFKILTYLYACVKRKTVFEEAAFYHAIGEIEKSYLTWMTCQKWCIIQRKRRYVDIDGNDVSNILENGRMRGRTKDEYESVTHFKNIK